MKSKDYERAWHELKDKLLSDYPYKIEFARELNGSYEFGMAEQIKRTGLAMDEKDGTQDFSNLLNDMGDE